MLEETCQWVKCLRSNSARDLLNPASKKFEYGIKMMEDIRMLIDFEKVFCILTIHIHVNHDQLRHQI